MESSRESRMTPRSRSRPAKGALPRGPRAGRREGRWLRNLAVASVVTCLPLAAAWAASPPGDESGSAVEVQRLRAQVRELSRQNAQQRAELAQVEGQLEQIQRGASQAPTGAAPPAQAATPAAAPTPPTQVRAVPRRHHATTAASVQAVYRQENALFQKGWTLTPSFEYAYSDHSVLALNGFLALGAIFLGNINVTQQKNNIETFSLDASYGFTPRLQAQIVAPYLFRQSTYTSIGQNESTSQSSEMTVETNHLGDLQFGLSYQAVAQHGLWPNLILTLQGLAPTGASPYGIAVIHDQSNNDLEFPAALPTGQGAWGAEAGLTFIKTVSPAVFYASLDYYKMFARGVPNLSAEPDELEPGEAEPGDTVAVNLGTAFALTRRVSLNFGYQELFTQATMEKPDGAPWQKIVGSDTNAASFQLGAAYAVTSRLSVDGTASIGMTQSAPNTEFLLTFPYTF